MLFQGFGLQIFVGTLYTIALALLSLALSFVLGLIGAAAKLAKNRVVRGMGTLYTTLVRSVPDLVLMLLMFYSAQIWLNSLIDQFNNLGAWLNAHWGWPLFSHDPVDIKPLGAGVVVLGFIYGAYFTETFRGAFLSVPRGQLEAGHAYGMTRGQVFWRIMFPQMMRFALPGIGNNWQVLVKSTALVSIIGLGDVVKTTQDAGMNTLRYFFFTLVAGAIYLAITTVSNVALMYLEKHYSTGVRSADL